MSREPLSEHGHVRVRTFSLDPVTDRALKALKSRMGAASYSEVVRTLIRDRYRKEDHHARKTP